MSDFDVKAILQELEELKKKTGLINPQPELPPRRHFSPSDAVELAKFEQFESPITHAAGKPPGNPWKFRPYPRMLYMARQTQNGKWTLCLDRPERYDYPTENQWDMAMQKYRAFAESCLRLVANEREHEAARADGWRDSAAEALAYREEQQKAIGQAAAERAYEDRNMGDLAKAEAEAAEKEHFGHLAEIPEKKRRGRPPKAKPEAAA